MSMPDATREEYRALALDPRGDDHYEGEARSTWLEAVDALREKWVCDGREIRVEVRTVTETVWRRRIGP